MVVLLLGVGVDVVVVVGGLVGAGDVVLISVVVERGSSVVVLGKLRSLVVLESIASTVSISDSSLVVACVVLVLVVLCIVAFSLGLHLRALNGFAVVLVLVELVLLLLVSRLKFLHGS